MVATRLLTAAVTSLPKRPYFIVIFLFGFVFVLQQRHNPVYFQNLLQHSSDDKNWTCQAPAEPPVQRTYISPLCHCGKEVAIGDDRNVSDIEDDDRFKWCGDEATIRGANQRIITYSLYGNVHNASIFRRYYSVLRNISLTAEKWYPGWTIRIYHNIREQPGPDMEAFRNLCDIYCRYSNVDLCSVPELVDRIGVNNTTPIDPQLLKGLNPKMFRYLVMMDPDVDTFISRDVDSIIWRREVDAVHQWLQSNYTFHLMRDHMFHGSIILAGMWGAKLHQRRDLIEGLMRALVLSGQDQSGSQDQASLDRIVWPAAKFDVMAHDSYQCENPHITRTSPLKVLPFPTQRDGRYYIGGAGHELYPDKCPVACRPPDHKDWEYC